MHDPREAYKFEIEETLRKVKEGRIDVRELLRDLVLFVSNDSVRVGEESGRTLTLLMIEREVLFAALSGSAASARFDDEGNFTKVLVAHAFAISDEVSIVVSRRLRESDARAGKV